MSRLSRATALCLCAAFPLVAQDPPAESSAAAKPPVKWGFGVSLSPMALIIDPSVGFLPLGLSNFVVPIQLSSGATIEPEFGVFRSSSDGSGGSSEFSNTRLGLGVLASLKERAGLKPYVGPRFAVSRSSSDLGGGGTSKRTTWFFSGVFGAQHFFSPHFSLGGEIQLTRASVGAETITPTPPFPTSDTQTFVTTGGVVMLRWFF